MRKGKGAIDLANQSQHLAKVVKPLLCSLQELQEKAPLHTITDKTHTPPPPPHSLSHPSQVARPRQCTSSRPWRTPYALQAAFAPD
jgi:hypothetical protein